MSAKVMWKNSRWTILPGLLIYNLIGRHLLYRRACRSWADLGNDPAMIPYPRWLAMHAIATWPKSDKPSVAGKSRA